MTESLFGQDPILEKLKMLNERCNTGDKAACKELVNIAKTHGSPPVRQEAVKYLTDQVVLMEIAQNERDDFIRFAAFEKVTDDSILFQVARTDRYYSEGAIKKIKSQSYLAIIARSGLDHRDIAVQRLTDSQLLAQIALTDMDRLIRQTALMNPNLTDVTTLSTIAQTDTDPSIRRAAVVNPNLTDQKILANIERSESDPYVRTAAFLKPFVADYQLLDRMTGKDWWSSQAAGGYVDRIVSQDTLAFLAKNAPLLGLSSMALRRLKDQTLIADVYDNAKDESIRAEVVNKLTDQKKLFSIVQTAKDTIMRINAVNRIADTVSLLSVLKDRRAPGEVRTQAAKRMLMIRPHTDPQIIAPSLTEIGLAAVRNGKRSLYQDIFLTLHELNPAKSENMRQMVPKGSFEGSLRSEKTKTPLANFTIFLAEVLNDDECLLFSDLIVPTDVSGKFVMKNVPIGKYTIAFSERIQTTGLFATQVRRISYSISMQQGNFESGRLVRGTRSLFSKDLAGYINFIIRDGSFLQFDIKRGKPLVQDIEVYLLNK
jgi:hypothetical protein